eukprot:5487723-Lingulodinium_polyedra.AAC.1
MLYLAGGSRDAAAKTLAAVVWRDASLSRAAGARMALSPQAMRGWARLAPSAGRLPVPYCVLCV